MACLLSLIIDISDGITDSNFIIFNKTFYRRTLTMDLYTIAKNIIDDGSNGNAVDIVLATATTTKI